MAKKGREKVNRGTATSANARELGAVENESKRESIKQNAPAPTLPGPAVRNSEAYLLVVIGVVSAFGPFLTDFYLPALPALARWFEAPASLVQLSLTVSMVGLAVGQLLFGPLSDKYGRKAPLLGSMVLFVAATVACIGGLCLVMSFSSLVG